MDEAFLRKIGERQQADLRRYLRTHMQQPEIISRDWSSQVSALSHFLGSDHVTKSNAYQAPSTYWGFYPTEPQITKGWAHFLSEDLTDAEKRAIVSHFCNAMCRSSGLLDMIVSLEEATEIKVQSEVQAQKKFIDLFISWKDKEGRQDGFVVELKFGHKVTPGQLPTYRNSTKKKLKNGLENRYFVIEPQTRLSTQKSLRRNRDWRLSNWDGFLRVFEQDLPLVGSTNRNEQFAAFRKMIWEKNQ